MRPDKFQSFPGNQFFAMVEGGHVIRIFQMAGTGASSPARQPWLSPWVKCQSEIGDSSLKSVEVKPLPGQKKKGH